MSILPCFLFVVLVAARDSGDNRDAPEEARLVAVMMEVDRHGSVEEEVPEHSDRHGDTMDGGCYCCCFPDIAVDWFWRTMEVLLLDIDAGGVAAVYACWHCGAVDRIPPSRRDHCCCCFREDHRIVRLDLH